MNKIKLFIVGLIIGIGKIIPGVSGAIFAMLFGVYEDIIECISNPIKIRTKLNKLVPIGIGFIFAIIFGSNLIKIMLNNCYVEAIFFFIGMMCFGLIPLINEVKVLKKSNKEIIISLIAIIFISSFFFIDFRGNGIVNQTGLREFVSLFLCGIVDAASAIIPGVSGTALLLILGYYEVIITNLAYMSSLKTFIDGFITLVPFFIGMGTGLIFISKLVNYLFKHYTVIIKMSIIGFALISILILFFSVISLITFNNILSIIILFIAGYITSYIIECKLVFKSN